jgi:hypothetical protein
MFRLAAGGGGSIPLVLVLFSVIILMLIIFSYLKNNLLTTYINTSGIITEKEDSRMNKTTIVKRQILVSVLELCFALGTNLVTHGGPLA